MPRRAGCMMHIGDFANMLKAFMGSAFLGVSYAFSQSGIVLGAVGVLLVASLTDHCCHLIIKIKYHAINKILREFGRQNPGIGEGSSGYDTDSESLPRDSCSPDDTQLNPENTSVKAMLKEHMIKHMSYGDVGSLSLGRLGLSLVNFFLASNQFCFCVAYFIFIGNTIHRLLPMSECIKATNVTTSNVTNSSFFYSTVLRTTTESPVSTNSTLLVSKRALDSIELRTVTPSWIENTTTVKNFCLMKTAGPSLVILVASPLPIFLMFALIRSIRKMSSISVIANVSILGGCVAIFVYIFVGFEVNPGYKLIDLGNAAVCFGMVTAAFEGIGLVIPVEASMEGNRRNFSLVLHGAVLVLGLILSLFGILGYLRFSNGVQQMINLNIESGTFVFFAVNITICIGVLLTFPIQLYPVIEMIEGFLFSQGSIFGPQPEEVPILEEGLRSSDPLLSKSDSKLQQAMKRLPITVAVNIPDSVAAWKRNIVRVMLVLIMAALAVVFREKFAYVAAFAGALGCTALGFVLPCVFHLKLCGQNLSKPIIIKDILIIIFGILASVVSVYYVVDNLVSGATNHASSR